jgi:hypothetical protein
MKSVWRLCVTLFLATGLVAQTATAPESPKKKAATLTAADIQSLKDAIASQAAALAQQQRQIQELRDELRKREQTVQQAQAAATDAAGKADAAQAQAAQDQQSVTALKSDVTDLKSNLANTVVTVQEAQKNVSEPPTAIHVKGITITPGGFLAAETAWRSRALAADVNTPFNNVTMPGASQSTMSEFFGSGRQSRVSMLVEGRLKDVKLSGYVESDFLSAAATSNNNQSNSYSLRQRQAWGQAAFDNGWSFTGGQQWSLLTETKHGMDNRTEALPMTIDAAYHVGFSWARQYGVRLVKDFNNKVWFGVSVENAQATLSTHGNAANFLLGSAGAGGGLYNPTVTACSSTSTLNSTTGAVSTSTTCTPTYPYAFNPSPDIVAKIVFEPGFGHYEVFGLFSRFRDRVFPCAEASAGSATTGLPCGTTIVAPSVSGAYDSAKSGGGFGANARWSFANKRIDFGLHFLGGNGIGRYGSGGLADTSVHGNGTLDLVRNYQGLATLEWHSPKLDVYLNAGTEYNSRAYDFDLISGKYVGYGSPTFNNVGCYSETLPQNGAGFLPGSLSNCTADTRALTEGTVGFWYRLYNGPKGRVQWGPQLSYVNRQAWSGAGGEPHGLDGMVFTSFRYYLP